MASFARGLTGGFETGLRFGQAMREREKFEREEQQRKDLAAAYGISPQQNLAREATPEEFQRAQTETQALQAQDAEMFGLSPQEAQQYAPQMPVEGQRVATPTYTLGGQTLIRQPTEFDIDAARTRAAANVYGKYGDTARREELLRGLRVEERAISAEQRAQLEDQRRAAEALRAAARGDREAKAFEGQQKELGFRLRALAETEEDKAAVKNFDTAFSKVANPTIDDLNRLLNENKVPGALQDAARQRFLTGKGLERTESAAQRMIQFNDWRAANPNAGFQEITAKTTSLGMNIDEQFKIASNLTGIDEATFKASEMRIRKLVQGKNLDGLLKAHKESDDLDPGTHFEVIRGKGGSLTLNRVDSKTGTVIQPNVFTGTEAEATTYLNRAATDPSTIVDFTMNLQKNKAAIEASRAATAASQATSGLRAEQLRDLRTTQANAAARQEVMDKFDKLSEDDKAGPAGQALIKQFNLLNAKAGGMVPIGPSPKTGGRQFELSDLDKENLRYYRDWLKDPKNAKRPQGEKDAMAAELGVTEFIKRSTQGPDTGFGANPYAAPTSAPTAAPAAASTGLSTTPPRAAAPALTPDNTRILSAAGNSGFNVQLPDGTSRVMSVSELERMGYRFPSGTGLQRSWYSDLLPGR